LASAGVRIGGIYALCKIQGKPFELRRQEFDRRDFALPEDRPAGFYGIHGSGNPEDGKKIDEMLEGSSTDGAATVEHPGNRWSSMRERIQMPRMPWKRD
jgi:hypothetical protein